MAKPRKPGRRSHPTAATQTTETKPDASKTKPASKYPVEQQIRIKNLLFATVKNAVVSANNGGDYTFSSASEFIREALREHGQGKKLTHVAEDGSRDKTLTLRIDEEIKEYYHSWPKWKRPELVERAVLTKLHDFTHGK